LSHLSDAAQEFLQASDEARITHILSEHEICYPRADEILASLEDLLNHPCVYRMPNMLIIGKTNNGKTSIARTFLSLHKPRYDPSEEADDVPVLYIQAPPVPDERRFNASLLDKLRVPHKINERADRMFAQLLGTMPGLGVKMLIIDEIHHMLAGNLQKQRAFQNVLKSIGNELQIPIVALGTGDALYALQTDAQLANRFVPHVLPEWKLDKLYLSLLASFEQTLPLRKPSRLTDPTLARWIFSMCGGTIGETATLLKTAAVKAIRTGSEQISLPLLESLDWTEPSQRRARAADLL
jgi:hypothetical protein